MNATMTALRQTLEDRKPLLREIYSTQVRNTFAYLVGSFGETMTGIYNSRSVHVWKNTVQPVTRSERIDGRTFRYSIDDERLAKHAGEYADAVVESWAGKIEAKLEELDEATTRYLSGTSFEITGERAGRKIRIEQNMIVNVSTKGKVFNQFPARIYVDGQFMSEAKYKKLFA